MYLLLLKYYPYIIAAIVLALDIITAYRIIIDTHNSAKTLAYLLLVFILPVIGSVFYFSFGVNYRKKKIYSKKIISNDMLYRDIMERLITTSKKTEDAFGKELQYYKDIVHFLMNDSSSLLFPRLAPLWGIPSDAMSGRSGLSSYHYLEKDGGCFWERTAIL